MPGTDYREVTWGSAGMLNDPGPINPMQGEAMLITTCSKSWREAWRMARRLANAIQLRSPAKAPTVAIRFPPSSQTNRRGVVDLRGDAKRAGGLAAHNCHAQCAGHGASALGGPGKRSSKATSTSSTSSTSFFRALLDHSIRKQPAPVSKQNMANNLDSMPQRGVCRPQTETRATTESSIPRQSSAVQPQPLDELCTSRAH